MSYRISSEFLVNRTYIVAIYQCRIPAQVKRSISVDFKTKPYGGIHRLPKWILINLRFQVDVIFRERNGYICPYDSSQSMTRNGKETHMCQFTPDKGEAQNFPGKPRYWSGPEAKNNWTKKEYAQ